MSKIKVGDKRFVAMNYQITYYEPKLKNFKTKDALEKFCKRMNIPDGIEGRASVYVKDTQDNWRSWIALNWIRAAGQTILADDPFTRVEHQSPQAET